MVQMFTSRAEMLDKGETTKEHLRNQTEEAARLEEDKANDHPTRGGLFGGLFRPKVAAPQPVFDVDDGVIRCPNCTWELEEGNTCPGCGYEYQGSHADSDSDLSQDPYSGEGEGESEIDSIEDDERHNASGGGPWGNFSRYHPGLDSDSGGHALSSLGNMPSSRDALLALSGRGRPNPHPNQPGYLANDYAYDEELYSDEEEEGENEYDEDDPFIDDDGAAGPPTSSFIGHHEHDVSGEVYDLDSDSSTGTAVDDDHDEVEHPSTDELLQWRNATPYIEEDSDEPGNEEVVRDSDDDSNDDSDEEDVQVVPPRQRQPQLASRSQPFQVPSEAPWLRARGASARDASESAVVARARNRRPVIPDSDEAEESSNSESSSPAAFEPTRPIGRGASVGNAISLDDSDDDQPVGPVRRNTQRRNNRFSPY